MLNRISYQPFQKPPKVYGYLLILIVVSLIFGCHQNRSADYVKLEEPLKDVLPNLTLVVPEEEDVNGEPIEIKVGDAFSGKGKYSIGNGETHVFQYNFFKQHAVEGSKYIFAVVSYNWGGSGTFYYLTVIDKTTLKSVDNVLLGDRIEVKSVALSHENSDTVSVSYMDRETDTPMAAKADKQMEKHFEMEQGNLKQVAHEH